MPSSDTNYLSREFVIPGTAIEFRASGFGDERCRIGNEDLLLFEDRFTSVWKTIPEPNRQEIESYWRQPQISPPRAELQGIWFGDDYAIASTEWKMMKYRWKICGDQMPERVLETLIAHEMSHVIQWARGFDHTRTRSDLRGSIPFPDFGFPLQPDAIVEHDADEQMLEWGYDWVLPWAYMRQWYDYKSRDFVRRKKPRNSERSYKHAKENRLKNRFDLRLFLDSLELRRDVHDDAAPI